MTISLVRPTMRRADEYLAAVRRSRALHTPWVHPPRTRDALREALRLGRRPSCLGYWVCAADGAIAGEINVNEIVRRAFQSGYLGYCAFVPYAGRGCMTAGLRAVLAEAFGREGLHRLEANIQPGNDASRRLVERCGFSLEGYSPRYLKIAGRWRDHERWAITAEAWRAARRR